MSAPSLSATTLASNEFVAAHRAQAEAAGAHLADLIDRPDDFAAALADGLAAVADPVNADGVRFVAPGLDAVLGVRLPLLSAMHKAFTRRVRRSPTPVLLTVAERLAREDVAEVRWFAMWSLERYLATDPERTWQLLRRFAREAHEWISVDTLAHPYGRGIDLDPRRWAELEQLVYSPSRWERRLVGSTIATMQHGRKSTPNDVYVARSLDLVGQLIGDDEPDVQKALSWALRSLAQVDLDATTHFIRIETDATVASGDGHRAWVIRDSLSKLRAADAAAIRAGLEGVRKRPGAPSTSRAAGTAAEFLPGLPGSPVQASGSSAQ